MTSIWVLANFELPLSLVLEVTKERLSTVSSSIREDDNPNLTSVADENRAHMSFEKTKSAFFVISLGR